MSKIKIKVCSCEDCFNVLTDPGLCDVCKRLGCTPERCLRGPTSEELAQAEEQGELARTTPRADPPR